MIAMTPARITFLRSFPDSATEDEFLALLTAADEADRLRAERDELLAAIMRLPEDPAGDGPDERVGAVRARVARLEAALRTVRWGCATAEEQAAARYGASWRNEVIDAALAGGES